MSAPRAQLARSRRVLVVDDEPQIRDLLAESLERAGFDVDTAGDGIEALKCFRTYPADVVVTDIIMPDQEGIETIIQLRRENPELAIIAISGGGAIAPDGYLGTARLLGARSTFAKPFSIADLVAEAVRIVEEDLEQ
jgi:DNA-binding response OmpR family regulator